MSLYPENPAGQILQVVSQDTLANAYSALSVVGGGGSGPSPTNPNPQFSTVTVSSITTASTITVNGITTADSTNLITMSVNGGEYDGALLLTGNKNSVVALDGPDLDMQFVGSTGERIEAGFGGFIFNNKFNIAPLGTLSLPSISAVSSIAFIPGAGVLTNVSSINGAPYSAGGAPTPNPNFSTVGISSILNFQANAGVITNLSSINGSPYSAGGTPTLNPTFSTIQVSTVQTPVTPPNVSPGGVAFNTVIGGMRMTAGYAYPVTNAALTTVTWPTPFTTVPIVLTGCTGDVGVNTAAMVLAAGESSAGFSVNVATQTGVYYLAFGAA